MNPADYAKSGSEYAEQCALFMWAALNKQKYPLLEKLMFAIKNEEKSGNKIVGGHFKASGVKAGTPDIFVSIARKGKHGLYIEMKKIGGKPSKEQVEFGCHAQIADYEWKCCEGWEKARDIIVEYLS